jgi:uncharacterized protein DUF4115
MESPAGPRAEREQCAIAYWRGYVWARFYADLGEPTLRESPRFRSAAGPLPENDGAVRDAYDALVRDLLADGWELAGRGAQWYEAKFDRCETEGAAAVVPHVLSPRPESARKPAEPRSSRKLRILAYTVVAAASVAAVGATLASGHSTVGQPPAALGAKTPMRHVEPQVAHRVVPARQRAIVRVADLRITAVEASSWLEVRRGSAAGAVLYESILEPGTTLHFRAPRLWLRMGAAGNLDVIENGRPLSVQGTYDKLVLPPRG